CTFELNADEVCVQAHALTDDKPTDLVIAPSQPAVVESRKNTSTKSWITIEVDRMKAAGETIASPTALSKELEKRMKEAARANQSIQPVSKGYIRGLLYELELVTPGRHRR